MHRELQSFSSNYVISLCWLFGLPTARHYYPTSHCMIWLSEGDKCEMILIDEGNRGNKDSFM
jgi:hypothetical protein